MAARDFAYHPGSASKQLLNIRVAAILFGTTIYPHALDAQYRRVRK
jgi:hypothetical protein